MGNHDGNSRDGTVTSIRSFDFMIGTMLYLCILHQSAEIYIQRTKIMAVGSGKFPEARNLF